MDESKLTRMAYSVEQFAEATDISRSSLYEEIKAGRLVARKCGKRTIISVHDAEAWLESLPHAQTKTLAG
jgi:excisionase family DNA binding protein